MEFPPDKLQEKLDEKFPISTTELEESAALEVLLSEPQPILEEGKDQIGFRLKADVIPPHITMLGFLANQGVNQSKEIS